MKTLASCVALTMLVVACVAGGEPEPTSDESEGVTESAIQLDDESLIGKTCSHDWECTTNRCKDGYCVQCVQNSDCGRWGTCSQNVCTF